MKLHCSQAEAERADVGGCSLELLAVCYVTRRRDSELERGKQDEEGLRRRLCILLNLDKSHEEPQTSNV